MKSQVQGAHGFDVTATYEWAMVLYDNFLRDKPLMVVTLEDAGEVVGILPCYFRARGPQLAASMCRAPSVSATRPVPSLCIA